MIGMTQLASEWGLAMKGNMFADSSAALGIAKRRGSGKMRDMSRLGPAGFKRKMRPENSNTPKVPGYSNPADLMTKNVNRRTLEIWQHYSCNTSEKDGLRTHYTCRPPAAEASAEEEVRRYPLLDGLSSQFVSFHSCYFSSVLPCFFEKNIY